MFFKEKMNKCIIEIKFSAISLNTLCQNLYRMEHRNHKYTRRSKNLKM